MGKRPGRGEGLLKPNPVSGSVLWYDFIYNLCKYYVASDGLFDQIGAATKCPIGYKPFKSIILEHHNDNIEDIFDEIWHTFEAYRGEECHRDDVALVGFRV